MTSILKSIFGSRADILSSQVEAMKAAESALMQFALHRFNDTDIHGVDFGLNGNRASKKTHTLQLFDTKIPRSAVPLKEGKNWDCQLGSCPSKDTTSEDEDKESSLILHGVEVTSHIHNGDKTEAPLVLLHGYANGALYFYRNLLGLANHCFGGKVYALDLLGWGLSSRPKFQLKKLRVNDNLDGNKSNGGRSTTTHHDETHVAEQVFVESLEEWRKAHNIDKMVLGGHSMGGYLSVAYCEKYPQNVERLILMSPIGVPDDTNLDIEGRIKDASLTFKMVVGVVRNLYNVGVTPPSFVRRMPEKRGRTMVRNYVERRLPSITCPEEKEHLTEYLYMNAALPGSGENCLNKILKPTTFAFQPTLHRIPRLKVKNVSFIYGQNDWTDPTGGIETMVLCDQLRRENNDSGRNQETQVPKVQVFGVKNSGHLLMLENWKEFNSAVIMSAGKGGRLPLHAPKPYKVMEPAASSNFFAASRWGRKEEHDNMTPEEGNVSPA